MPGYFDITGKRFGKLTVVRHFGSNHNGHALWLCLCDCGMTTTVFATNLKRGYTKSCGCSQSRLTHGHTRDGFTTREYDTWKNIHARCYNPNFIGFRYYGGRGITVCEHWHDFESFYADMGPRPRGKYSIERIDNDKGYSPENCKWLPMSEQPKNRRKYKVDRRRRANASATLTESQVLIIRADFAAGLTPKMLQEKYLISKSTIKKIVYRTTWKHI